MKIDLNSVLGVLGIFGSACIFVLVSWMIYRTGIDRVQARTTENWKEHAESLQTRVSDLEIKRQESDTKRQELSTQCTVISEQNKALVDVNNQLVKLNLALQTEATEAAIHIRALESEISSLKSRINELEKHSPVTV